ncbi:MAG: hypothetical protein QXT74_05860 [Candidatus Nezhaarchaeales archaeon]
MAESSPIFRRSEVQKILKAIKDGRLEAVEPVFSYEAGVGYPKLREITNTSGEAVQHVLNELEKTGILVSEVVDNIVVCPRCGSHRLSLQMRCPICESAKLSRGAMIEHMACGHLDVEENYRRGDRLICPKCGKALKAIGVDYRRPGILYRCMSCGGFFPTPKVRYRCNNGHSFEETETAIREIKAYRPNPAKRALLEEVTFDLKAALKPLTDRGWHVEAPSTLRGRTGVEHDVSFALWASGSARSNASPDIVGELHVSEAKVDSVATLAFWAKATDLGARDKVLMAVPGLDDKASTLACSYGIHVVEAENMSELQGKLNAVLQGIIKGREREALKAEAEALEDVLRKLSECNED